jgi:endoglucanase
MLKHIFILVILFSYHLCSYAQGYLHASGKKIVNGNNEEIILRGIGTGNWLLQEGYMMKSADFAGTQHEFRKKLIQNIGTERTDAFYKSWLDNHFTRTDVDSMKVWGFNSVRVAMHYKWLTLPIEDEPVSGQDTWLEDGFVRLDSLLDWCSDNEMYLILDLHGAPGGQGKDANISDYDPTKPSLWESSENRRKTVALWARLAERYSNEPWIGGYDLINEPNWDLPGGIKLRELYIEITNAIRAVDVNHMIIIEGNWFANDYTGLTPPWDNNMAYSGHKYWTFNTQDDLNYMVNIRENWNVPIWLGETGENSNSWFTGLIELCESNNIGWSWWPVKKAGINNVLQVPESQSYENLLSFWKVGYPSVTPDQAFNAVMDWSENHRIENCEVKRDVIDAMIRQPHSTSTIPFRIYKPGDQINAVNYDMGRSSYAYWDTDTANYNLSTNSYTAWNKGWSYRNDGVDIEKCNDTYPGSNGYSVGWTETGEWMQYSIIADSAAAYTLTIRSASLNADAGIVHLSVNGTDICSPFSLKTSGGWNIWSNTTQNGIILPSGRNSLRIHFDRGGSNINIFSFTSPVKVSTIAFYCISAETSNTGNEIIVTLNREITTFNAIPSDFRITSNGNPLVINHLTRVTGNDNKLIISLSGTVRFDEILKLSYYGGTIKSSESFLGAFTNKIVKNTLPSRFIIPSKIEAENFKLNSGFQLENCIDNGGGKNTAYASNGDYLDYLVWVPEEGEYEIMFRVASLYSNGVVSLRASSGNEFETIGTLSVPNTGGWQVWTTKSIMVNLPAGNITFRLYSVEGEYNINWFSIAGPTGINDNTLSGSFKVYPNPGNGIFRMVTSFIQGEKMTIKVKDLMGRDVYKGDPLWISSEIKELNLSYLVPGMYLVQVSSSKGNSSAKLLIR